jgi:outer membrane scaffolding protein for murein synthesis (MipA/OmpV family)
MPDGSRDMYVGLGVQSLPRYDGARHNKTQALPVLQVQWSNGIFVSGLMAGWHLSSQPALEYGPLIALQPRRDEHGTSGGIGGVGDGSGGGAGATSIRPGEDFEAKSNPLLGLDVIHERLLYGGFFNYYLTPALRLSNNLLYGYGNEHDGLRLHTSLQYMLPNALAHHSFVLSAGVSVVNSAYTNAYFGVSTHENARTQMRPFRAGGGVQDVRLGLRWNWALSPSWMLTSGAQVTRLLGDAKDSPLTERPTNVTVSTALAYRF